MHGDQRRVLSGRADLEWVVASLLDRMGPPSTTLDYRLVGTGAALAQGVALPARDVDILVAWRTDVDAVAEALPNLVHAGPRWCADARRYGTRLRIGGVDVKISTAEPPVHADTLECLGAGPWRHFALVELGPRWVPAVSLELRLVSELVRCRAHHVDRLIAHLRSHGVDVRLLRRAMRDRAIDPARQTRVLDRLGAPAALPAAQGQELATSPAAVPHPGLDAILVSTFGLGRLPGGAEGARRPAVAGHR